MAPSARAEPQGAKKVVFHLADAEKAVFALGNIRNHIEGTGGAGAIAIALVVHGRALNSFRADTHGEEIKAGVAEAAKADVTLYACAHTMAAQKLTLSDLLPGFVVAEKGDVVALADLQAQGWAYLGP
jgi:intracellular sulfur oxidation DsrE/DsrF family protein